MARNAETRVTEAVDAKLDAGTKWLLRREIDKLPRLVPRGEEILFLAQGRLGAGTGMVVVTERRLMFVEQGISHRRVEDFPYLDLESIQTDIDVVSSELILSPFGGERTTISRVYPKDRTMEIADYVRSRTSVPGEPGHRLGRQPSSG